MLCAALRRIAARSPLCPAAANTLRMASTSPEAAAARSNVDLDFVRRLKSLDEITPNVYRANFVRPGSVHTNNVYGGLIFAQSMEAAGRSVDDQAKGFTPHSIQGIFILNGSTKAPIDYRVQRLRDGRSFATRSVQAVQDGKIVFTAQVSLCIKEPTSIEHQAKMPVVPAPEQLASYYEVARQHLRQHEQGAIRLPDWVVSHMRHRLAEEPSCVFDFRPTTPLRHMGLEQHTPYDPVSYWTRPVLRVPDAAEDPSLRLFLLAYMTDGTMPAVANQPHYGNGYRPSMILSLDHCVHFHDDVFDINDWMLYENWSNVARNGRAFSEGRVWTRDGRLVLSVQQESLSRTRQDPSKI